MSKKDNTTDMGLQKFTELRTAGQVREYLHDKSGEEVLEVVRHFAAMMDASQAGEEIPLPIHTMQEVFSAAVEVYSPEDGEDTRRRIWVENHRQIIKYMKDMVRDGIVPNVTDIARDTGLSRTTVYKHINGGLAETMQAEVNKYRELIPSALHGLYKIGMEHRNVSALKAFINFLHRPEADSPPPIVGMQIIDSNIQINNLSLTQDDIESLPPDTLAQVEELISQALK